MQKLQELEKENIRHELAEEKENARYAKVLAKIREGCTHSGTIKRKSQYYFGGYDYKSKTERWNQCEVCGVRSEVTVDYGGFQ